MKELFLTEGNSILTFKKGDIVTRVIPATIKSKETNDNLGIEVEVIQRVDGSFMGDACEFLGIHNNQIWLEVKMFSKPFSISLQDYAEGWELFECPEGYNISDY